MSGGTTAYVTAGKPKTTGAVYVANLGTTLPTDATTLATTVSANYTNLGYVSQDGVTRSISKSTTNIKEWGNGVVLVTQDEKTTTVKLKLIEYLNANVQAFVHGSGNVSGTLVAGMHIGINDDEAEEHVIVIDQIMRDGVPQRMVIPRGVITEIGDTTYKGNDAVAYDLTILAMKPDSGNNIEEYIGGSSGGSGASSGTSGGSE